MSFQEISKFYDLLASPTRLDGEVAHLAQWLGKAKRVLDLGCGLGDHSARLASEHGFEMLALDADPGMVQEGRIRHPGLKIVLGDLRCPPQGPWDAIFCVGNSLACLEAGEDWAKVFAQWKRVMAPEGRCLVQLTLPPGDGEERTVVRQDSERELTKTLRRTGEKTCQLEVKVTYRSSPAQVYHHRQNLQVLSGQELSTAFESAGWAGVTLHPQHPTSVDTHFTIEADSKGA